jgi:UDPglucose--hexose-1-phosphate uridylyltransferase
MAKDKCIAYVASFFNWGSMAGASLWHPHYQILSLPIIPPHNVRSLRGAEEYFKKNKRCVRCDVVKNELRERKRIIEENAYAIAIAPYASKEPFEISILPKKHLPYFEKTPPQVTRAVVSMLQSIMQRIKNNLNDPDLNFFIHDAPVARRDYNYHHWHIEVMPKVSIHAGFELSTGIDINVVEPETAAKILRGK